MSKDTNAPKTLDDYNTTLRSLRTRLAQNREDASRIPSRRGELALAAADGDRTALDKMRELESEEQTLAIEAKNLNAAIEQAETLRAPLLEEANRQGLKERRAKTQEIIGRYVDASEAVDEALIKLREALDAQKEVGAELYAYEWSYEEQTARGWAQSVHSYTVMNTSGFLVHAAASAGLQPYLPHVIPSIAASDRLTMAERARQGLQLPADRIDDEDR